MKTLRVYDPPMCCSSGVCGPSVDPALARFAADLDWLRGLGVEVQRFNLAQEPLAFVQEPVVRTFLQERGADHLPLVLVDGAPVAAGAYPDREALRKALDVTVPAPGGCCGPKGCCGA